MNDDDPFAIDVATDEDRDLAAYYRDPAEVNEVIANLYLLDDGDQATGASDEASPTAEGERNGFDV